MKKLSIDQIREKVTDDLSRYFGTKHQERVAEVLENHIEQYRVLNSIDLTELREFLNNLLNLQIQLEGEIEFTGHHKRYYLMLTSQNLVADSGIFKSVMDSVIIDSNGGAYTKDSDVVWFSIHLKYTHLEGGSNGLKIMDAWYNVDTKLWFFTKVHNYSLQVTHSESEIVE